jgi:hypothetical protein
MEKQENKNKKEKKPEKVVLTVVDDSFDKDGFIIDDARLLEGIAGEDGMEVIMIPNMARYKYFKEKDREHIEKDKNYDYRYVLAIGNTRKMGLDKHQPRKELIHLMEDKYGFINFDYSDVKVDYHIPNDSILNGEEAEFVHARKMLPKFKRVEKYLNILKISHAYKLAKGLINQPFHIYSPFRAGVLEKQDKKSENIEDLIVRDDEVNNPDNYK